jgi:hypothetical protein
MIMGEIQDGHCHRVKIPFPVLGQSTVAGKVNELTKFITDVKEWSIEQCDWEDDKFHLSLCDRYIEVWFEREETAFLCMLRWL